MFSLAEIEHLLAHEHEKGVPRFAFAMQDKTGERIDVAYDCTSDGGFTIPSPQIAPMKLMERPEPTFTAPKGLAAPETAKRQLERFQAIVEITRSLVSVMHDSQNVDAVVKITPAQLRAAVERRGIPCSHINRDISALEDDAGPHFNLEFYILFNASDDPAFVLNYTQKDFVARIGRVLGLAGRKKDRATAHLVMDEYASLALPGGKRQYQDPNG